ncbi:MAG TPA: TetR/AcrR family transcriptional regulator [Conexibacter sp.]|nr:TetR/AcrR family transcriptional regulator [Conexibacter sp.]
MAVPQQMPWTSLSAAEKRTRTLAVADELFAREGVDVPMPVLARAIGVGVGSIYRQVGTKDDVIGALVIERSAILRARFLATLEAPDPWASLAAATHATVDDCIDDALSQTAWDEAAFVSAEVAAARADATEALDRMVRRAQAAGVVADDVTHQDLRILFCALRELGDIGPDAAHRLADLVLRGLRR